MNLNENKDIKPEIIEIPNSDTENIENIEKDSFLDYIIKYSKKIFIFNSIVLLISFILLLYFTISIDRFDNNFILNQVLKYSLIIIIQYAMALLVINYNTKVNYTRKVIHMSYFLLPQLIDNVIIKYKKNIYTECWNIWIILFLLLLISEEIRKRFNFINVMFKAVDRPEDRPYTLIWFSSQVIFTLIIIIPFSVYFSKIEKEHLIFIPILINALGDGLAEPVGIRFGKNKYKTRACFSSREYERSFEGSFCVFIVSLIIILCYIPYLSINQVLFCLFLIPISSTVAEAYAPHTWDSPIITLVVCSLLSISQQMK